MSLGREFTAHYMNLEPDHKTNENENMEHPEDRDHPPTDSTMTGVPYWNGTSRDMRRNGG